MPESLPKESIETWRTEAEKALAGGTASRVLCNRVLELIKEMERRDETPKKVGRYEGDILAHLLHDPVRKYGYRVQVAVWSTRWEDEGDWYNPNPVLARITAKEFKTLKSAVKYLFAVREEAELKYLQTKTFKAAETRWERIS